MNEYQISRRHIGNVSGEGSDVRIQVGYADTEEELGAGHVLLSLFPSPPPDYHGDSDTEALKQAINEGWLPQVALEPYAAIALANRLTRGANVVLESKEGGPDADRELRKLGG